jgi:acetyltransferase-like isoleucine patch superfamily enzyme
LARSDGIDDVEGNVVDVVRLTPEVLARLKRSGVECFSAGWLPGNTALEPPCSLKWMSPEFSLSLGAFSYAVSGYYFHVSIGRYTSIAEQVQIGRGDHPVRWLSTSPVFYIRPPLFDVGFDFIGGAEYQAFRPELAPGAVPTILKKTIVGNDVYIGHGAFIRPGVTIGNGAAIGAYAVVLKDVPPYAVVAGNPATIKRFRVPPEMIGRLQKLAWWRFAPWQLVGIDISKPEIAVDALEKLIPTLQPYMPAVVQLRQLAEAINTEPTKG